MEQNSGETLTAPAAQARVKRSCFAEYQLLHLKNLKNQIKIKNLFKQEEVNGLNNFLFPSRIEWLQELAPCPHWTGCRAS